MQQNVLSDDVVGSGIAPAARRKDSQRQSGYECSETKECDECGQLRIPPAALDLTAASQKCASARCRCGHAPCIDVSEACFRETLICQRERRASAVPAIAAPLEPIQEVEIERQGIGLVRRRSMMRIMARRTKATTVLA